FKYGEMVEVRKADNFFEVVFFVGWVFLNLGPNALPYSMIFEWGGRRWTIGYRPDAIRPHQPTQGTNAMQGPAQGPAQAPLQAPVPPQPQPQPQPQGQRQDEPVLQQGLRFRWTPFATGQP
ncbi:hypothetical protein DL93DRAFT_2084465, partial [Clavulina sp. PMI_390]